MQFGQSIAAHVQQGTALPTQHTVLAEFLCEGSSRPNPGPTKMVLHDETRFISYHEADGTNHRAIYSAISAALKEAGRRNATDVHISLASKFVWRQVTGNEGVDKLEREWDGVLQQANRFHSVKWHLVGPPFTVSTGTADTARALRRMAP